MNAVTGTPTSTSALQATLQSARVSQARSEADRAQAYAQNLRDQADAAQAEADKSQARLRDLSSQTVINLQGQATGRIVNVRA